MRGSGLTDNDWEGYWALLFHLFAANPPSYAYISDNRPELTNDLPYVPFEPGDSWHTYRVEAKGDNIRFFVDGNFLVFAI